MAFTEKYLSVPTPIQVGGRTIKRYHVATYDTAIEPEVEKAAYDFLPRLLPPVDDETPAAAFVVLHRSREAAYLNAYSWVWGNVIHCETSAAGQPVVDCPDDDPTNFIKIARPWIGCVWELPPLAHERTAWVQHVLDPDKPNLDAYLADQLPEGRIGR